MIQLQDVSLTFHKGTSQEVQALQDIHLHIHPKEFVVLIGANGSGKSTLLNVIAGTFSPQKGKVQLDGNDVTHFSDFQRSRWIARIFQNPLSGTAPDLSVIDNFRIASLRTRSKMLRLGINTSFRKEVQEKISLLGMGLENKLEQKMGTLSGGQRQALTLIMAIMDKAHILLMDEPTAALDPKSAKNLMEKAQLIIQEFQLTAILVTHNLQDAHLFGSRMIQMREGKILRDVKGEAKSDVALKQLFEWFVE